MNPGIYLSLGAIVALVVLFMFLMRSADKKLAESKSKSKSRRR